MHTYLSADYYSTDIKFSLIKPFAQSIHNFKKLFNPVEVLRPDVDVNNASPPLNQRLKQVPSYAKILVAAIALLIPIINTFVLLILCLIDKPALEANRKAEREEAALKLYEENLAKRQKENPSGSTSSSSELPSVAAKTLKLAATVLANPLVAKTVTGITGLKADQAIGCALNARTAALAFSHGKIKIAFYFLSIALGNAVNTGINFVPGFTQLKNFNREMGQE